MTELKTFNDWKRKFELLDKGDEMSIEFFLEHLEKLKQEAIKWIKEIKSDNLIDKECKACIESKTKIINRKNDSPIVFDESEQHLLINWIKYFFNIIEEDLK